MSHTQAVSVPVTSFDTDRHRELTLRTLRDKTFLLFSTASAANRPHVAGLLYQEVDGYLYMNTHRDSVKIRNVRENPRVAINIPFRRYPLLPPYSVQFQGEATLLEPDDPAITGLVREGKLKRITSHGELDLPGVVFIRVRPGRTVATFGLGVPLLTFLKDPLGAGRSIAWRG